VQPTAPTVAAVTLFVEDLAAARAFYGGALELAELFSDEDSVAFGLANLVVNCLQVQAADELVTPARVGGPDAGARAQLTLSVDDVDARCAELTARGVTLLNGPQDRPWGVRTAAFADPAGHVWELAGPVRR
jgi:catechol 2,3-dioxygenase-like lactoylglutathione lyase family enzyme